jgi:hypothetical protein
MNNVRIEVRDSKSRTPFDRASVCEQMRCCQTVTVRAIMLQERNGNRDCDNACGDAMFVFTVDVALFMWSQCRTIIASKLKG